LDDPTRAIRLVARATPVNRKFGTRDQDQGMRLLDAYD
jgi:hypothetical protein